MLIFPNNIVLLQIAFATSLRAKSRVYGFSIMISLTFLHSSSFNRNFAIVEESMTKTNDKPRPSARG